MKEWLVLGVALLLASCGGDDDSGFNLEGNPVEISATPLPGDYKLEGFRLQYNNGNELTEDDLDVVGEFSIGTDSACGQRLVVNSNVVQVAFHLVELAQQSPTKFAVVARNDATGASNEIGMEFHGDTLVTMVKADKKADPSGIGFTEWDYWLPVY
jgi:hypothetical protein